jgi:hypothetical protein
MMIAWYQPTAVRNSRALTHICQDDAKITYCGLDIDRKWIVWNRDTNNDKEVTCKKCLVLDYDKEKK